MPRLVGGSGGSADLTAALARVSALEARSATWTGRWTIVSGQTDYLLADALTLEGTATGDASTSELGARLLAGGLLQDADTYSILADRVRLASSPPAELAGGDLVASLVRAAT
jgi:hypothetical protein